MQIPIELSGYGLVEFRGIQRANLAEDHFGLIRTPKRLYRPEDLLAMCVGDGPTLTITWNRGRLGVTAH